MTLIIICTTMLIDRPLRGGAVLRLLVNGWRRGETERPMLVTGLRPAYDEVDRWLTLNDDLSPLLALATQQMVDLTDLVID